MNLEYFFVDMGILSALITFAAILFAGISKGGFGSGAAFAAAPALALVMEPEVAIGLMLPLLMLMDVTGVYFYWKKWIKSAAFVLIIGGIPGVIFGAIFFLYANPDILKGMIGLIALLFVLNSFFVSRNYYKFSYSLPYQISGYFWGTLSGFASCISHAGGPPVAIYLLSKNISKTEYQAITILVFWVINLVKLVPFLYFGLISYETLRVSLWFLPVALLGTWIGVKMHILVSEKNFYILVNLILFFAGVKLLYESCRGLVAF